MIGASVGCRRTGRARGTWRRFDGRTGRIVAITVARSVSPEWPDVVEVGVSFDNSRNVTAWFLPSELVIQASQRPLSDVLGPDGQLLPNELEAA